MPFNFVHFADDVDVSDQSLRAEVANLKEKIQELEEDLSLERNRGLHLHVKNTHNFILAYCRICTFQLRLRSMMPWSRTSPKWFDSINN